MPEHLRAFVYIALMAGLVFLRGRAVSLQTGYKASEFRNHVLMWLLITFSLFSHMIFRFRAHAQD